MSKLEISPTAVRFAEGDKPRIKAAADYDGRSVASFIRRAVMHAVDKHESEIEWVTENK